jgi:hypothetical protein
VSDNPTPFDGWSLEHLLTWIEEQGPAFHHALREDLWKRPEILSEAVRKLRKIATDPDTPDHVRRAAETHLQTWGCDDESLHNEDLE